MTEKLKTTAEQREGWRVGLTAYLIRCDYAGRLAAFLSDALEDIDALVTRSADTVDETMLEACADFRDRVLNQRCQFEEPCLDNDQTNAVLKAFDETIGAAISRSAKGERGGEAVSLDGDFVVGKVLMCHVHHCGFNLDTGCLLCLQDLHEAMQADNFRDTLEAFKSPRTKVLPAPPAATEQKEAGE